MNRTAVAKELLAIARNITAWRVSMVHWVTENRHLNIYWEDLLDESENLIERFNQVGYNSFSVHPYGHENESRPFIEKGRFGLYSLDRKTVERINRLSYRDYTTEKEEESEEDFSHLPGMRKLHLI